MIERSAGDWERSQQRIEAFEKLWGMGRRPRIDDHLPDDPVHRLEILIELVHAELEFRLKAGEDARVEDYLKPYPELWLSRSTVVDLIWTEWKVRKRKERGLKIDRYRERFPDLADRLVLPPGDGSTIADFDPPTKVEPSPTVLGDGGSLPRRLGKYELRQRVGAGSFGIVYRAWDTVIRREVAVKVPKAEASTSPGDVRVFLREARNAIHLRHPNIVTVHDAGPIDGIECVVRAYVEGGTLAERLLEGPIEPAKAAELMVFVAEALEHAHLNGIIHRDLKPSNILMDLQGRPHLADFGLARREAGDSTLSPGGVAVGPIIGTPAYMSPEQARGEADRVDARSDVYSAGVVFYEMLTGTTPFRGRGRLLQIQIEAAEPTAPRSLNEDVPADLESICLRSLAKIPDDRYPSASALAADLKNFLDGRPVVSRPGTPPEPSRKPRRWFIGTGSAILVVVLSVVAGWLGVESQTRRLEDSRRLGEALRSLREVASLPYPGGTDGPEAHRRVTDLARTRTIDLARSLGDRPGLLRSRTEVMVEAARRAAEIGSDRETLAAWDEAVEALEGLVAEHPYDFKALADHAEGLAELARIEARAGRIEISKSLKSEALRLRKKIRQSREALAASKPSEIGPMLDLSEAIVEEDAIGREAGEPGDIRPAEALAREVVERSDLGSADGVRLARIWTALSYRERDSGQARRALTMARQSAKLTGAIPGDGVMAVERARSSLAMGLACRDSGQHIEALDHFRVAARLFARLGAIAPLDEDHARDMASAEYEAGRLVDDLSRADEAIGSFGRAISAREGIRVRHPARADVSARIAEVRAAIGLSLDRRGRPLLAASAFFHATLDDLRAVTLAPGDRGYRSAMVEHARATGRIMCRFLGRMRAASFRVG